MRDRHFHRVSLGELLTNKKTKKILDGFIGIVNESRRKSKILWVGQGREFYNKLMRKWLDNNDVLIYSIYNEDMSVVAERFLRT